MLDSTIYLFGRVNILPSGLELLGVVPPHATPLFSNNLPLYHTDTFQQVYLTKLHVVKIFRVSYVQLLQMH